MRRRALKGSLTLEAAVVLPLFLFFFMSLLSIMEMMHFSMRTDHELSRAAKTIAVYASARDILGGDGGTVGGVAATVLADSYVAGELEKKIPEEYRRQMGLQGDISLLRSKVLLGDDLVDLLAEYRMEPCCNAFGLPQQYLLSRARVHAWTGYELGSGSSGGGSMEDPIVYVTETGTVYHLSRSCTHLDLSIHPIDSKDIKNARNADGGKYKRCELCGGGSGVVYITDEGDRYHSSLTCSGLKRTIYEIPLSQVGDKRKCKRCGG